MAVIVQQDLESCLDHVLLRLGKKLRVATPLGGGKPNHLLNALYRRAKVDPSIELTLYTALSLQKPAAKSELEQRFLGPFVARTYDNYPDLEYETDRVRGALPDNVKVIEFYFLAGKYLHEPDAQRDYISSNYTHVARDLCARGVNLVLQQVAASTIDGQARLSLSCNADLTIDLLDALGSGSSNAAPFLAVAQINPELPFMYGDAVLPYDRFDIVIDNPALAYQLFTTPRMSVADEDHMIGLYASSLVKDGGTLQIGIGALGDAISHSLTLRHTDNAAYRAAITRLGVAARFGPVIDRVGGLDPFQEGLFACSEMLVDGFMHLYRAGILKREVDGAIAHAGFFLGPQALYDWLNDMPESERKRIQMRSVTKINQLYGHEMEDRQDRKHARFINTGMIGTLLGAMTSDALDSHAVVSGVGGQYNFVAMAQELTGGRSVLQFRSTRTHQGHVTSSVVWSYGHVTIPRHLRDMVVTEYGIADLRGKTDEECIIAMLNITDSRFQDDLRQQAVEAGKLSRDHVIPQQHRNNLPESYTPVLAALREQGHFAAFPFGTDFTDVEITLARALRNLKANFGRAASALEAAAEALVDGGMEEHLTPYLERMDLLHPHTLKDKLYQRLLIAELKQDPALRR